VCLFASRVGPGSSPGLASGICGGQSGVGAGFLLVSPAKTVHSKNFIIIIIIITIIRGS
jgi:hypothetical protein